LGEGSGSVFSAVPPAHRFDLQIEEDLIEEIIRVIGYDQLPARPPKADVVMQSVSETRRPLHAVRHAVAALGYQEVVNFGFVQIDWERDFAGNHDAVRLLNPIASHLEVMRSTLIGSLVANLKHNLSHRADRVRVFEVARVFKRDPSVTAGPMTVAGFDQPRKLAGLAYGCAEQIQWSTGQRVVDFFDVKGDVEALLPVEARFEAADHPALHPGRSAHVLVNGVRVGVVGQLHPKWVQKYELPSAPVVFELEFSVLQGLSIPAYEEVSKQPIVQRDLALVVKTQVSAQAVLDVLHLGAIEQAKWVKSLFLFDEFKPKEDGKGLQLDEKSLAFRIILQDSEKSIEEAQVESLLKKMIASAAAKCGAYLR
jgi:phenylalanyl-tRNA synthetase beta chain